MRQLPGCYLLVVINIEQIAALDESKNKVKPLTVPTRDR
jgi:hypothetical protein